MAEKLKSETVGMGESTSDIQLLHDKHHWLGENMARQMMSQQVRCRHGHDGPQRAGKLEKKQLAKQVSCGNGRDSSQWPGRMGWDWKTNKQARQVCRTKSYSETAKIPHKTAG